MSATTAPIENTTANANSGCLSRMVRRVFFTMVQHPKYGWMRVGKAYASKNSAQEWVPFVRSYWRGLRTKVVSCTLRFVDGKLTAASEKTLDVKFNMAPPDNLEITSGERTAIELANTEGQTRGGSRVV